MHLYLFIYNFHQSVIATTCTLMVIALNIAENKNKNLASQFMLLLIECIQYASQHTCIL